MIIEPLLALLKTIVPRREANARPNDHAAAPAPAAPLLILACLAQFMVILDVSVVNVALPAIRSHLHFTEADLQWVVNAYTVTFAGFLLLGGRAADLLGRRRVFVSGLVLFALASLAGGLADSQGVLIAARAVQGLGGAVIAPASLSILTTTFSEGAARNRAVGIWGAMGGAGGAAGVLLGGDPHRPAELALDPLHQRPDRRDRRALRAAPDPRGPQRRTHPELRPRRRARRDAGPVDRRARDRPHRRDRLGLRRRRSG